MAKMLMETATFVEEVFRKLVDSSLKCLLQISCKSFSLVSVFGSFIVWNPTMIFCCNDLLFKNKHVICMYFVWRVSAQEPK